MTPDEKTIRDLQQSWLSATAAGDLPRLLQMMTDDVVFLTPGRPPFGREEFAAAFAAGVGKVQIAAEGELEEVIVVGDVAYTRGRLRVEITPAGVDTLRKMAGFTLSIFRRRPDGTWALARDANLLAPAESPQ